MRKGTCNIPKLDIVNMNTYIKFGKNLSLFVCKILSRNEMLEYIKGHVDSVYKLKNIVPLIFFQRSVLK